MQAATRRQRSTTSPASQRHTRTSKPYLCIGVMEREKWSLRTGEESTRGGKIPPPLEPAPPLTPIGTPVTPNLPRAGGPGPSRPGPMAARGVPPDPTAEEKTTPPHHSVSSQTTKDNKTPGKAHLPRLYWTPPPPPPAEAPMHRRPPHQSRAQAHAPTHASGGTPTRTQAPQAQP